MMLTVAIPPGADHGGLANGERVTLIGANALFAEVVREDGEPVSVWTDWLMTDSGVMLDQVQAEGTP